MMGLKEEKLEELVRFRRELHSFPELSGKEDETRVRIRKKLEDLGISRVYDIGKKGLLAEIPGSEKGPTLMFRAELDALPIDEQNQFPHASRHEGVAHKCGHDGHATILVGLAALLAAEPPRKGRVLLLFQSAEETGEGARWVVEDPVFEQFKPDQSYALHNLPGVEEGEVVIKDGAFTAAVTTLILNFRGKTAHASQPETGKNPVYAMSDLLSALKAIENPDQEHPDFSLITPVYVQAGALAYGTAAGQGEIHLTIRARTDDKLYSVCSQVTDLANAICADKELIMESGKEQTFAATVNDPECVSRIKDAAERIGKPVKIVDFPFRWGEDFGLFTAGYPGAMFGLGAGINIPALHNPDYDFPDSLLPAGIEIFWEILNKEIR